MWKPAVPFSQPFKLDFNRRSRDCLSLQHKGRELDLGESLDGYPAALQNIIKNQARQISYSHVPDGGARRNQ